MASAIDGLISGLQTTDLIASLMRVEAAPQALLKTKMTTTESRVTALQAVNTKLASLGETAKTAAKPASWNAYTASSSAASTATATATATAQPGSISFSVDQVATTQVSLSNAVPDGNTLVPSLPPSVTVRKADGTYLTVEPTTGSLTDIAKAVNDAADAGVRATVVRVSNGATAEYRIQFTGATTGADGSFKVFAGTQAQAEAAIAGGQAAEDALRIDGNAVRTAQDASITLWKGSVGLEQTFTQSSNTFSGLMTGVDVTVAKATAAGEDPVTVKVAQDATAVNKLAADLVTSLGVVLGDIASRTKATTKTADDGRTVVTGGLLSGDSGIRSIQQQLLTAASSPVDGFSPAEVGIVVGKDGTFTFDSKKFATALAADPAKVQAMISQLATRVAGVADDASDKTTGALTLKITGQESLVKDFGIQIESWDRRLELRQTALEKTYSALEVSLSKLNAQSSWLTSQLDSLKSSNS